MRSFAVWLLLVSANVGLGSPIRELASLSGQALRAKVIPLLSSIGLNKLLHLAAIDGNLALTELLVELGADLKSEDSDNLIPLRHAERIATERQSVSHMRVASFLLEKTRGVNEGDEQGWRAIVWSILARDIPRIKELLAKNADIFSGRTRGIQIAGRHNAVEIAELLADDEIIKILADHAPDRYFPVAIANGYKKFAQAMIARGIDVNLRGSRQLRAIDEAAKAGRLDDVQMLIANGARVDNLVLIFAAYSGNPKLVQMILEQHEVDVNANDYRSFGMKLNALEMVLVGESATRVSKGRRKIIRMLLKYGAELPFFELDSGQLKTRIARGEASASNEYLKLWNLHKRHWHYKTSLLQVAIHRRDAAMLKLVLSYLTDSFLPQGIVALALVKTLAKTFSGATEEMQQLLVKHAVTLGLDEEKFVNDADSLFELLTGLSYDRHGRFVSLNLTVAEVIKNEDLDSLKKLFKWEAISKQVGSGSAESFFSRLGDSKEQFQLEALKISADHWQGKVPLPVAVATGNYQAIKESAYDNFESWSHAIDLARFTDDSKALSLLLLQTNHLKNLAVRAVETNDLNLLELVISHDFDDKKTILGESLVVAAKHRDSSSLVELLLAHGADPNYVYWNEDKIKKD